MVVCLRSPMLQFSCSPLSRRLLLEVSLGDESKPDSDLFVVGCVTLEARKIHYVPIVLALKFDVEIISQLDSNVVMV